MVVHTRTGENPWVVARGSYAIRVGRFREAGGIFFVEPGGRRDD